MDENKKNALLHQLRAAVQQHLSNLTEERKAAVEKMQDLGARDDEDALALLIGYLTSENELLRPLAASRLSEIGDTRVIEQLLTLLENNPNTNVRALVLQVLGEIADASIAPTLARVLENDVDSDVRSRAALALGKTGSPEAYSALATALEKDAEVKVRQQVIIALGYLRDKRIVPDLVQIMETEGDKETRTFAAESLGRIGSEDCFLPLVEALANQEFPPIVRYYVAYALGLMGDRRALEPLAAASQDSHSWIAQMAGESLAKIQAIENH